MSFETAIVRPATDKVYRKAYKIQAKAKSAAAEKTRRRLDNIRVEQMKKIQQRQKEKEHE